MDTPLAVTIFMAADFMVADFMAADLATGAAIANLSLLLSD
jgi:hypothetical protein